MSRKCTPALGKPVKTALPMQTRVYQHSQDHLRFPLRDLEVPFLEGLLLIGQGSISYESWLILEP